MNIEYKVYYYPPEIPNLVTEIQGRRLPNGLDQTLALLNRFRSIEGDAKEALSLFHLFENAIWDANPHIIRPTVTPTMQLMNLNPEHFPFRDIIYSNGVRFTGSINEETLTGIGTLTNSVGNAHYGVLIGGSPKGFCFHTYWSANTLAPFLYQSPQKPL